MHDLTHRFSRFTSPENESSGSNRSLNSARLREPRGMVDDQENLYPTYFDDFVVQRIKAADELVFDALYQGRISYSKDPNVRATDSILGS